MRVPDPGTQHFADLAPGFDEGSGLPIVVVQPLQGRWEWTAPVLRALASRARTVSYSFAAVPRSKHRPGTEEVLDRRPGTEGFDDYVEELGDVMDAAGLDRAAVCGISFGGAVAVRFAARYPQRVTHLVIASSPGPGWRMNATQAGYVAKPWLSLPAFTAGALNRVAPEVFSAIDTWRGRFTFAFRSALVALRYPAMPHRMAQRVQQLERLDLTGDCARITAPTLVITGDAQLDRVVPVESTKRYAALIQGARCVMMERTGHQGVLTQPERFAALVSEFVNASHP
jgi:pimeloyl-ACP methyl ester carboxylesterase